MAAIAYPEELGVDVRLAPLRKREVFRQVVATRDSVFKRGLPGEERGMRRYGLTARDDLHQWLVDRFHAREFATGGELVDGAFRELARGGGWICLLEHPDVAATLCGVEINTADCSLIPNVSKLLLFATSVT